MTSSNDPAWNNIRPSIGASTAHCGATRHNVTVRHGFACRPVMAFNNTRRHPFNVRIRGKSGNRRHPHEGSIRVPSSPIGRRWMVYNMFRASEGGASTTPRGRAMVAEPAPPARPKHTESVHAWRGDSIWIKAKSNLNSTTSTDSRTSSIQRFPRMSGRFVCPENLDCGRGNGPSMMASHSPS